MSTTRRYAASGVDEPREQQALAGMLRNFARTVGVRTGVGSAIAETDHFGSLIRLAGNLGLAITTDGVGTKLMLAQQLRRYKEIAHDLVANNVNDVLCMGATPVSLVDYIGIDVADERFLEEFSSALADAALAAHVAIVGGEIAQIGGMLNPNHGSPRFELVATAVGICKLSDEETEGNWPKALDRNNVKPGDVLIGLRSSGLHSNGYSLARRVLLTEAGLHLESTPPALGGATLADALLTPTRIYVDALLPLLQAGLATGIANISGGGFLTISRLNPRVGFEITEVPEPQPIFDLIRVSGNLGPGEMLSTFNMGLGMVIAVAPNNVDRAKQLLTQNDEKATIIGRVVPPKRLGEVIVRPAGVRGAGHEFELM